MKVFMCAKSPRAQTYADAMAAAISKFPGISEFIVCHFPDQDGETLLRQIDKELTELSSHKPYESAIRAKRCTKRIRQFSKSTFKGASFVDVSGMPKEEMAELLALGMSTGTSICFLSWDIAISAGKRYVVGIDEYRYVNCMELSVVSSLFYVHQAAWRLLFVFIILFFMSAIASFTPGIWQDYLNEKVMNVVGILTGFSGLAFSALTLRLFPIQNKLRED